MQIIAAKDFEEMSQLAAEIILKKVRSSTYVNLGLATGGTPVKTYEYLVREHQYNGTSYEHVHTFNLDEYVGLAPTDLNSYHFYMNQHLFEKINIPKENTHLPNGLASKADIEARMYEELLKEAGGVDLQILGIGENGHIGFNEPGTSFSMRTHVANLTESTRLANARYFKNFDEVPRQAITMGISTILDSKEILLLASGKKKAKAICELIHGKQDELWPVTALKGHHKVTLLAVKDALSLVEY